MLCYCYCYATLWSCCYCRVYAGCMSLNNKHNLHSYSMYVCMYTFTFYVYVDVYAIIPVQWTWPNEMHDLNERMNGISITLIIMV